MAFISSIGLFVPPYQLTQSTTAQFARDLFADSFNDIERLLKIFENGQVEKRHFSMPLAWFRMDHSFEEKNDLFIEKAVEYGCHAIVDCLKNSTFLISDVQFSEIDAIFYISSSGLSTPSIEAKIMNRLPFNKHCKRIPIWGLGCAGGASGLSRAFEYCKAYPKANVLVLSIELCSLTFQKNDLSKSNLVGTSLFADGVACALISGVETSIHHSSKLSYLPKIIATESTLKHDSEDVMGWDIKNDGFFVIFSKDIPSIICSWLKSNVEDFISSNNLTLKQIDNFIAHPGGKKVLDAYVKALDLQLGMLQNSEEVLVNYGNMSSATIFHVLKKHMEQEKYKEEIGLITALGPGFSSELLLLKWK